MSLHVKMVFDDKKKNVFVSIKHITRSVMLFTFIGDYFAIIKAVFSNQRGSQ